MRCVRCAVSRTGCNGVGEGRPRALSQRLRCKEGARGVERAVVVPWAPFNCVGGTALSQHEVRAALLTTRSSRACGPRYCTPGRLAAPRRLASPSTLSVALGHTANPLLSGSVNAAVYAASQGVRRGPMVLSGARGALRSRFACEVRRVVEPAAQLPIHHLAGDLSLHIHSGDVGCTSCLDWELGTMCLWRPVAMIYQALSTLGPHVCKLRVLLLFFEQIFVMDCLAHWYPTSTNGHTLLARDSMAGSDAPDRRC
jgi:hypothetical protein